MTSTTQAPRTAGKGAPPSREELVGRARDLVPLLRRNAAWTEEHRRLHEETIEALAGAGLLRLRVPRHYGGYEADTQTLNAVMVELGRGDASVAWTASVWSIPGWMVGMFPDEVQDEVYATPDVRVCGTLSSAATMTPTSGGMILNGQWNFISGAQHSHWQQVMAAVPAPDGNGQRKVMALVPLSDLRIVDDWFTSGLRGSGSVTTVAKDVFVPQARIRPMHAVLHGETVSARCAAIPMYRNPLVGVANASSAGTVIGMAKAALELFLERLPSRKITYTDYPSQAEAAITHLQVAQAAQQVDEAEFHGDRMTRFTDAKAATGAEWTLLERARTRADIGSVCQLGRAAVDILNRASGGSSIFTDVPIQRIARDMHAVVMHPINVPETNYELYGRILCGLGPNTPFV